MDKDKRNKLVLGVLAVMVIGIWVRGLTAPVGRQPVVSQASQPLPGVTPSLQVVPLSEPPVQERARTRKTDWDRNPFMLPGEGLVGIDDLVLNGIVWDDANPLAMVGNQVLGVGEMIGSRRITRITQTSITVEENGREFVLTLGGQ